MSRSHTSCDLNCCKSLLKLLFAQIFPDLNLKLKHIEARYVVAGLTNSDLEKQPTMQIGEVNIYYLLAAALDLRLLWTSSFLWLRTGRKTRFLFDRIHTQTLSWIVWFAKIFAFHRTVGFVFITVYCRLIVGDFNNVLSSISFSCCCCLTNFKLFPSQSPDASQCLLRVSAFKELFFSFPSKKWILLVLFILIRIF